MSLAELSFAFPNLNNSNSRITSPKDTNYNCIAWAAGYQNKWWWPDRFEQYYWPPNVSREATLDAFIKAFGLLEYCPCENGGKEEGFEKIALFHKNGIITHAARQLPNGRWTSKLGPQEDIEHILEILSGDECSEYGEIAVFLKKKVEGNCLES